MTPKKEISLDLMLTLQANMAGSQVKQELDSHLMEILWNAPDHKWVLREQLMESPDVSLCTLRY